MLFSSLCVSSLSRLLHFPRVEVNQTLKDLYAIFDILEDPNYPVHLHHPSFRDFLLNKDRCGDFWVDDKERRSRQSRTIRAWSLQSPSQPTASRPSRALMIVLGCYHRSSAPDAQGPFGLDPFSCLFTRRQAGRLRLS